MLPEQYLRINEQSANCGVRLLTSLGLIGKAIEILVTTVVKKQLDFALDDKKRTAKAFVRLHEALLGLEVVSTRFLKFIAGLKEGRNSKIYATYLEMAVDQLKPASLEFLNALREVSPVLAFYSPELQRLLGNVTVGKKGMLRNFFYIVQSGITDELASQEVDGQKLQFRFKRVDKDFATLDFTVPDDLLIDADMSSFDLSRETEFHFSGENTKIDLFDVVRSNLRDVHVDYLDIQKLIDLYPTLKHHQQVLAGARESLRLFIEARFSLSDVLYVIR